MRRPVAYAEGDAGIWSLQCSECPLEPHLAALGMKGKGCGGGIATNMQGPVVLFNCPHSAGTKTLQNDDGALSIDCLHGGAV